MKLNADHIRERFCVAGISYRQAGTDVRGLFAVDADQHRQVLEEARAKGFKSVFVISTCNRTEIYGYANHPHELAALLSRHTAGQYGEFIHHGFFMQGQEAMHHLFRVAAGLDSQIIGDYEIQGQLKQAIAVARSEQMIGPVMDRTLNFVFQASKKIRTTTGLSSGTVSVSFAAIEWLQQKVANRSLRALVVGTGKFGTNVCKNLLHYLPNISLTVCNRTPEKAEALAASLQVNSLPFEALAHQLNEFDIVVTSTAASEPIVKPHHFTSARERFVVDLSVPANVDKQVADLPGMHLANVDDISVILEQNIARRHTEVPKAEQIIAEFEQEFYNWLHTYKHTPAIKLVKQHLAQWSGQSGCEFAGQAAACDEEVRELVQQTVNNLVVNLKSKAEKGCYVIDAYQQFLNHPALAAKVS
ncbi:MAG: glutamyl-tRNA reductase [Chitinophagaceae bacterium]|jgi:glutamyl-tRNA reductase|nr:glutamyl-tRNA reductase [Chitinophagaceae bacterium]